MIEKIEFIELIKKLVKKNDYDEICNIAKEGNYSIEMFLDNYVWLDNSSNTETNEILLAIIYDRNVYLSRSEFREIYKSKPIQNKNLVVDDLINISKKMIFLYRLNYFTAVEKMLFDYITEQEENYKQLYSIHGLTIDISFRINGIEIFNINGQDATEEEIQEIGYNYEYFKDKIRASSDLIDISQIEYYSKLSVDAKYFIQAGNQYLSLLQDTSISIFNDYSPFILDFLKALEIETKELYLLFYESIFNSANNISKDINYQIQLATESDYFQKEELQYLLNLSKQILKFRKNYSPSGIKPLYYFIKYYAFNNNLKFIENYSSFISQSNDSFLEKNNNLISRLKNIGDLRNKTIHSNLIGSKEEFLMMYYDIVVALQLISILKKYAL
ncbi:MAG: hypothetical protein LC122_09635 [Chitinophagales bacterium]|nr:hypothetical protein [Chitinophagales bacterium]